jgi:uncharacterized membrane protein
MRTNRLEAFSDGVFTIAITLLVLEIKPPPTAAGLVDSLMGLWPSYVGYVVSFIVIGAIWINHHAMFDHIVRADQTMLLLNTFHLMFIAFLPFPTAVLAGSLHGGEGQATATALYGATLTVIGVLVTAMWHYAAQGHRLLSEKTSPEEACRIGRTLLVGPICYAIATAVALAAPAVALALFVGLNFFFLWPRDRGRRRLQPGNSRTGS